VCKRVLDVWLRLLAPFIPHVCEELWAKMGRQGFISLASWPQVEKGMISDEAEGAEAYVLRVIEDVERIKRAVKKERPARVCLYVAQEWKWGAYRIAASHVKAGRVDMGALAREVEERLKLRLHRADLFEFLKLLVREIRETPEEELELILGKGMDEFRVLADAAWAMKNELGAGDVQVYRADDPKRYDPQGRANLAVPLRPAIYIE
jgi:leucyl-tRNA synthetase